MFRAPRRDPGTEEYQRSLTLFAGCPAFDMNEYTCDPLPIVDR
jgi:hypothetical protein